ncbi:MAG: hypothetical protein NTW96_26255, partial [Planctomycetia bacterium]|nr:hypothetical protein [Planctomycetia bacterium]
MRRHPGGSLPDKLASPADLKALYRLCASPRVTHQAIVAAMRTYTFGRIADHDGPMLIIHDATELDYTSHESLGNDVGQIGKGTHRGYICHNVIAVDPSKGEALGVLDQILHCRDEVPEGETLTQRRNRDSRESLLWVNGTANLPDDRRLVDVADQGASTFEFLEHEFHGGRWVVEEYHKALKTGCAIEDLQFTAVERLQPAIALLSAVALTLLNLRDASRRPDATTRRADTLLGPEYIEALSIWRHGKPRG